MLFAVFDWEEETEERRKKTEDRREERWKMRCGTIEYWPDAVLGKVCYRYLTRILQMIRDRLPVDFPEIARRSPVDHP
jgi:hypothetical protein